MILTRIPPKVVSVLCILQVFTIIVGYALTRSAFIFYPHVVEMLGGLARPISLSTQCMLATGPWLLLIPFAWGIWSTLSADLEGGIAEVRPRQTLIGYALLLGISLFCYCSVSEMWDSLTRLRHVY